MAVNKNDVEKLAELSRIDISQEAAATVAQSICEVLSLVDQLQAIDTTGVQPMAHPLDALQRLRPDKVTEPDQREQLQAMAPAVEDGLYLVPRVIE